MNTSPARDGRLLAEHESGIIREAGFLQQREIFLLEAPFGMMLGLPVDVINHDLAMRLAHTKSTVALLLCETGPHFVQPSRRIALEFLHRLRQCQRRRQCNQQVEMVCSPAGRQ